MDKLKEKYAEVPEEEKPVAWKELAKDRVEKYKKSGLVLRGMRYNETFPIFNLCYFILIVEMQHLANFRYFFTNGSSV